MWGIKPNVYSDEKTASLLGSADCSEEVSDRNQRKAKATTGNSPAKNNEKPDDIPQTPSIPRSIPFYIKTPKTPVSPVKNVRNSSCNVRSTVLYRKSTLTPGRKQNSPAQKRCSKSPFSISLKHQNIMNGSSIDGKKGGKGDSIAPPRALRRFLSLVHLEATSFERYCNINCQQNYSHFDLINKSRSSWISPWQNSLCDLEPDATADFHEQATSKPFLLKGRFYSYGILSVDDSERQSSLCGEERDSKEVLDDTSKQDTDCSDASYSSESSDASQDSDSCDVENGASHEKSDVENTTVLKVQQPLRVKYIDEATMLTKELVMYSNEFLDRICEERGRKLSKIEIFESIINQSIEYKGEKLRVIRDTGEFLINLEKAIPRYHSPQKLTKNIAKPAARKIHSDPCGTRWWGNTEDRLGTNKWKTPDIKIHSTSTNDYLYTKNKKTQSMDSMNKIHSSSTNDYLYTKNKKRQSMDSVNSGDYFDKEGKQNGLSTTSMRRVNCDEIISSKFRLYFQFYSKLGGRLKSGAVISRTNSHFWLKRCGVVFDDVTFKIANDCFTASAKSKIVLNVTDYLQYLIAVAKRRRIFAMDIIRKLMSKGIDPSSIHDELEKSRQSTRPI